MQTEREKTRDNLRLKQPMAHIGPTRPGGHAQFDGNNTPRIPTTPTIRQLLQAEDATRSSPRASPTFGKDHDMEYDHTPQNKKSVLAKVKEKARKWRNSLRKKHNEDGNTTPSWGVSLEDDEDEEAEYLGAPMYESEMAPDGIKETARQHPRTSPVIAEKHVLASNVKSGSEQKSPRANSKPISPGANKKPITETVTSKQQEKENSPKITYPISSQIQSLPVSTSKAPEKAPEATIPQTAPASVAKKQAEKASASGLDQSAASSSSPGTSGPSPAPASAGPTSKIWDKGVSVKEYIVHKLEPGDDERALSKVISEAMTPRKGPGDAGVVEKVKGAVSSILWHEESAKPRTVYHSAQNSSSSIPISTNPHEVVEEESQGRILQAN